YFYTAFSEPSQGQPHFVTVGYVDGQVFVHYNSHTRKKQPQVSWMEKVGKEDHQYWKRETQISHHREGVFKENLETLRNRYNQSEGCMAVNSADGTKEGFEMYGYDGRTFLIFDTETLTWVALDPRPRSPRGNGMLFQHLIRE
ncbi:putative MHC class I antigen protein, partial [Naja naja]